MARRSPARSGQVPRQRHKDMRPVYLPGSDPHSKTYAAYIAQSWQCPGRPAGTGHYWVLPYELDLTPFKPMVGRCRYCGEEREYARYLPEDNPAVPEWLAGSLGARRR